MAAAKYPVTRAIRWLKSKKVEFEAIEYRYEDRGGTRVASRELGVDEHLFVKTLIFERPDKSPFIVLMHGDMEVSEKNMARHLGLKSVGPCLPEMASRHSGYMVGGTSPFGTRKAMNVYAQRTIFDLDSIHINGGKRGLMVRIAPQVIMQLGNVELVDVAVSAS